MSTPWTAANISRVDARRIRELRSTQLYLGVRSTPSASRSKLKALELPFVHKGTSISAFTFGSHPRHRGYRQLYGGGVVRASSPAAGVASRPTGVSVNECIPRLNPGNPRRARTPDAPG